jgi:SAM-dependent methyltransferase
VTTGPGPGQDHDPTTDGAGYLLANAAPEAMDRFSAFASLFDPSTFRHLDALGLTTGWHVWEVGAGGTSVVMGLAERVGPSGHVLATDLDTTWAVSATLPPQVDVRTHDVALDPPLGPFDLIHARLVLVHVPERDRALANLVAALRPGGWLCVEDADPALQPLACLNDDSPEAVRANDIRRGFRELLAGRGADLAFGRTLPRRLRAAGLTEVAADAAFPVAQPACRDLELATVRLIRGQLVEHGIATDDDVDQHLAAVAAGRLDLVQPPMFSCWGRRPA